MMVDQSSKNGYFLIRNPRVNTVRGGTNRAPSGGERTPTVKPVVMFNAGRMSSSTYPSGVWSVRTGRDAICIWSGGTSSCAPRDTTRSPLTSPSCHS